MEKDAWKVIQTVGLIHDTVCSKALHSEDFFLKALSK